MYHLILFFICTLLISIDGFNFESADFQQSGRAMAANNRLVVAIQNRSVPSFSAVANYTTSARFCSLEYNATNVTDLYAMMIGVASNGNIATNADSFVFVAYSRINRTIYLVMADIDFKTCELNASYPVNISQTNYTKYSTLAVDPTGRLAFYFWENNVHIERLNFTGPRNYVLIENITMRTYFYPVAVDIEDGWGILAGYPADGGLPLDESVLRPVVYRFTFTSCPSITCFRITHQWAVPRNIKSYAAIPTVDFFEKNSYKPLYDISVAINSNNRILVGIQALNTIFRLTNGLIAQGPIDSRTISNGVSVGFGKSVAWLDGTTAAVLFNAWDRLYTAWKSSSIDLYTLNSSVSLSNRQPAYTSFPNRLRKLSSSIQPQIIGMITVVSTGSLILMDVRGKVLIIRPSSIGWYPQTNIATSSKNAAIYLASITVCPSGMYKTDPSIGKDLFLGCNLCPAGSYRIANLTNGNRCFVCSPSSNFCPTGSTNNFLPSVLESEIQISAYPESPDNDVLEDIMLLNIFNINFPQDCLLKQPLFWGLIIMGIGCVILLIMAILKLTNKFQRQRQLIRGIFQQTDLIGEGELWIGGVASFAVLVICIFAYRFSSAFMNQYPIETAGESSFACDLGLFNAKFSTTMQSLATPLSENDQPLFDLLESQQFTLKVDLISTAFGPSHLTVALVTGSAARAIPVNASLRNGILYSTVVLNTQSSTIRYTLSDNLAIGAIRVGLSAPTLENDNYKVQPLQFSQVFNYTGRILTQDPQLTIELIPVVNETEALSSGDDNQYSAIWFPQYTYDYDQMFSPDTEFNSSHIKGNTILTIRLSKESYFVYNVQEPITRLTELVFTNILFTTMCIEFFALTFLFYKLAFHPFIKLFLRLIGIGKKSKKPAGISGCPYCKPFNVNTLPAYKIPIQRAETEQKPDVPIQRRSPLDHLPFEILD